MIGALFGFEFQPYRYAPVRAWPLVGGLRSTIKAPKLGSQFWLLLRTDFQHTVISAQVDRAV